MVYEFRKGIFFIRFIDKLNKENYQDILNQIKYLIEYNKFKYIVINIFAVKEIDIYGLKTLIKIIKIANKLDSKVVSCDKYNLLNKVLKNNIPNIQSELEVL